MPKLPRVSGAEVVRALERLGFAVARQRGSHIVLRRGSTHERLRFTNRPAERACQFVDWSLNADEIGWQEKTYQLPNGNTVT